jgi:hypothetical protein
VSDDFNPYYEWLGIPPKHQPANHYRLLGIERFEADPVVIEHAAEQRLTFLRTKQTGQRGKLADQLLNEISRAKVTLINANTKTKYDQALQNTLLKTAESTSSPGPQQSASAHTDRTGRTARSADRSRGRGRNGARKSPGRSSAASLLRFGLVAIVAIIAIAYGFYRWQQAAEQQRRQQAEIAQLEQRLNTEKNAKENSVKNETAAREEAEPERKEEAERKAKAARQLEEDDRRAQLAEQNVEEERKAKEKKEEEAERKAKEDATRNAKTKKEAAAVKQLKEEKQRQETLQWRKAHFTQQKNGAWQPNLSEQWGRELKQAKQTGSSVSKDGKQFKKREKEINKLMALVAAAKGALDAHNKTPILNNAVRAEWFHKQALLRKHWQQNTVLLNRKWRSFWTTAERFIKSLDNLEQEHPECEATFTKMRRLYKHPQMNRAKQIESDVKFSSLKETKKQTDLRVLQGIIDNAQPTKGKLIALNNQVQKLKAAQQAQQQQVKNRRK